MSNHLSIEVIESRVAGSTEPLEYSIIAADGYGTVVAKGYESMEALLEAYPTRWDVLEWLDSKPEFDGAFELDIDTVTLDCVTSIDFAGYPEDNSIGKIVKLN
jgi:hypothetical protein